MLTYPLQLLSKLQYLNIMTFLWSFVFMLFICMVLGSILTFPSLLWWGWCVVGCSLIWWLSWCAGGQRQPLLSLHCQSPPHLSIVSTIVYFKDQRGVGRLIPWSTTSGRILNKIPFCLSSLTHLPEPALAFIAVTISSQHSAVCLFVVWPALLNCMWRLSWHQLHQLTYFWLQLRLWPMWLVLVILQRHAWPST